jgi:hypothetical protein
MSLPVSLWQGFHKFPVEFLSTDANSTQKGSHNY